MEEGSGTHILVECPELIASVRVGVLNSLKLLVERKECQVRFCRTRGIRKSHIEWCDIYISVRGFEDVSRDIALFAKRAGRFLIYFLDDDLADIPPEIPSADFAVGSSAAENIQMILEQTDVLWAVNRLLASKYQKWCNRTTVTRVFAEVCPYQPEKFYQEPLRVLYAGSTDHSALVQEQLAPAVRRISEESPGMFDFTFIGANPKLNDLDNVRYIPFFASYEAYRDTVLNGQFSLGLAPGKREFFYRCKYFNKFVEYASVGIVGIYARQEPFGLIVEDGKNGFLSGNTVDDWVEQILRAAEDREKLERCAQASQDLLKREFSLSAITEQLEQEIPELLSYYVDDKKVPFILLPFAARYYIGRVKYNFRKYGLFAIPVLGFKLLQKIWKRFTSAKEGDMVVR